MSTQDVLTVVAIILIYHHVGLPIIRWIRQIIILRRAMKPFRTESRKDAMKKVGEWRDD